MASPLKTNNQKKLYIKTYGCQMNFYDSDKMADAMKPLGYSLEDSYIGSDIIVLNTCHIREKAAEKLYSELGRIRKEKDKLKAAGQNMTIVVAGCVGQAEGEEVFRRAPFVDIVVGPQSYHNLPDLVMDVGRKKKITSLDFVENEKFDALPEGELESPSAFLTIQEGCDKFCTYCVVPYTRGAEYSRTVPDVYREAINLVQRGAKEITLLWQNVIGYDVEGLDGDIWDLSQLIKHIAKIKGLERIRYMTSYPSDMHDGLYDMHANEPKLMPFLHLPVQAGSDKILKAMNRRHSSDEYKKIIERLREGRPDIAISSDFIVGFPGETDEDFKQTIKIIEEVGFSQCYSFKYSPRPGTPAATHEDQVEEVVKSERLAELQELINKQQSDFNKATMGMTLPVLFDRRGKQDGQLIGKSPYMQSVHVKASQELFGEIVDVKIDKCFANSVTGQI
jgi:tRNA-2-methylthio-N6-dimethylallyladenosine synthase